MKTRNKPASYALFSRRKKLIYTGSAGLDETKRQKKKEEERGVRDRLIDHYYERGDHRTVPGKMDLSKEVEFFDVRYGKVYDNRQTERELKQKLKPKFNKK